MSNETVHNQPIKNLSNVIQRDFGNLFSKKFTDQDVIDRVNNANVNKHRLKGTLFDLFGDHDFPNTIEELKFVVVHTILELRAYGEKDQPQNVYARAMRMLNLTGVTTKSDTRRATDKNVNGQKSKTTNIIPQVGSKPAPGSKFANAIRECIENDVFPDGANLDQKAMLAMRQYPFLKNQEFNSIRQYITNFQSGHWY